MHLSSKVKYFNEGTQLQMALKLEISIKVGRVWTPGAYLKYLEHVDP